MNSTLMLITLKNIKGTCYAYDRILVVLTEILDLSVEDILIVTVSILMILIPIIKMSYGKFK